MDTGWLSAWLMILCFPITTGTARPLGSPDLEAALRGRADVVYFTDFESENWTRDWRGFGHKRNIRLVDSTTSEHLRADFSGKALEVIIKKGEHYGASGKFVFKDKLGTEPEELYVRFYSYWVDYYRGGKKPATHDYHVYLDNLVITTGRRAGQYTPSAIRQ